MKVNLLMISGLAAIVAASALVWLIIAGAGAQIVDVTLKPGPTEIPKESFRNLKPAAMGAAGPSINPPTDPGVRTGAAGMGGFLPGISAAETAFLGSSSSSGAAFWFAQPWSVAGILLPGLGPRYNANTCSACHAQPALGGSSPDPNNEVAMATLSGANTNTVPNFITLHGPTRVPYQKSTGALLKLYTIVGMSDAGGCPTMPGSLTQPDFATLTTNNDLSFHTPISLAGVGLVEATPSSNLIAAQNPSRMASLGITSGRFNRAADGIAHIGTKGAVSSIRYFADLALTAELGVTNGTFPRKSDEVAGCTLNGLPEDAPRTTRLSPNSGSIGADYSTQADLDATFARYLAPPTPVTSYTSSVVGSVSSGSITNGQAQFIAAGCDACHIQHQTTGLSQMTGQSNLQYTPWSDYAIHAMGVGLSDGLTQGAAGPRDFKTSPLWGAGQKIFFLHDGRTTDLNQAIQAHSSTGSEANQTVTNFNNLSTANQQDVLNFLRAQ